MAAINGQDIKCFVMFMQHQYNALQKHVDQLICENTRLTDELQHTLEEKLPALISTAPPVDSELSAIDNLQTQLSLAVQV